ncbi:MAG: conserved phage C-terminal domain-containing protein [Longibaculum sp.]
MNYITILDFMVSDLGLKGNELIIFALIYGFSQDDVSDFHGSLSYIQERTGLSRQTVIDTLKKLVDKNMITKSTEFRNNTKICMYSTSQEIRLGVVKNLDLGSQEIRPPILYNKNYIKKDNSQVDEETKNKVTEIIKYLNLKTNKNLRVEAKVNREQIEARLKEGYTIKDFKYVIDVKTQEWLHSDMEAWLVPSTLFRPKNFERYLNQKMLNGNKENPKNIDEEFPIV